MSSPSSASVPAQGLVDAFLDGLHPADGTYGALSDAWDTGDQPRQALKAQGPNNASDDGDRGDAVRRSMFSAWVRDVRTRQVTRGCSGKACRTMLSLTMLRPPPPPKPVRSGWW